VRFLAASSCFLRYSQPAGDAPFVFLCVGLLDRVSYGSPKLAPNTIDSEHHSQVSSIGDALLRAQLLSCPRLCFFLPRSGIGKQPNIYLFLSKPACFLIFLSPSANHLLASTSWTRLTNCLKAMTGKLIAQRIHGTVLSILLARAYSIAAAEKGDAKKVDGLGTAGEPGRRESGSPVTPFAGSRLGVMVGEEKQRR
jgi:hypothetical protein